MSQQVEERVDVRSRRCRDDWPLAVAASVAAALDWRAVTQLGAVDLAVGSGADAQQVGLVSVIVCAVVVAMAASGLRVA